MSSLKARRPKRGAGASRRNAPPPPRPGVPRLVALKRMSETRGADAQVTGKSLALGLTAIVLFAGAGVAGAAWLGQGLFDAREAFQRNADGAAARAGFTIDTIRITGVAGARAAEVRALIVPEGRNSLLSLDPVEVQARVQSLDWVKSARVTRLWPATLQIDVTRREAFARWQENGQISLIDANGERLLAERAADYPNLPLVVGAGAGPAAQPVLAALEDLPAVRSRLTALVRVGDRRWNAQLRSGTIIKLPEADAEAIAALSELERLHGQDRLLDRPLADLDLRAEGRLAVRIHPALEGARQVAAGGA